ncbi:MAG: cupredoxin domain-containing protein [Candidatus Limnocylindria bacterium]
MIVRRVPAIAMLLIVAAAVAGCGTAEPAPEPVTISIHYSAFKPASISVPHGVPVTFVLVNEDPIDHEWLIGDDAFHAAHRTGTHAAHGARPTEVTVPALSSVETTITFDEPGTFAFICHLPGHEGYGMVGTLTVS